MKAKIYYMYHAFLVYMISTLALPQAVSYVIYIPWLRGIYQQDSRDISLRQSQGQMRIIYPKYTFTYLLPVWYFKLLIALLEGRWFFFFCIPVDLLKIPKMRKNYIHSIYLEIIQKLKCRFTKYNTWSNDQIRVLRLVIKKVLLNRF